MQAAMFTQSTALAGARLSAKQTTPVAARTSVRVQALLGKFRASPEPKSAKPVKKTLVAGKDIKATQFDLDLGVTRKRVALGFTKSNELFVSRMAMIGIAAALIGEVLTGQGALAQLGYELHESIFDVEFEILAVIAFNLIAAFLPARGKFVPDEEELAPRPKGPLQDPRITLLEPKKFFGITNFGFTKANELFVGRLAQLGFAAGLIGEAVTGKGILGQLQIETGIPINQAEPLLLAFIAFFLFASINEGSGKFVDEQK